MIALPTNHHSADARTRRVLRFIEQWWSSPGRSCGPSVRDIAEGCEISSVSAVDYHLDKLQAAGLISRVKGISRSIYPTSRRTPELKMIAVAGRRLWLTYAECLACEEKLPITSFQQDEMTLEIAATCDKCSQQR